MDINNILKTAWIRQLKVDWGIANYGYFKDSMRLPNLELSYAEGVLGKWRGGYHRRLSISIILINNYTWEYVQEVLYHEMVHQYVEEVLGIREDVPHGEVFKRICQENGIDPMATGDIQTWMENRNNNSTASSENHKILDKVHKLLALAQSANEHEAQNAMAKAHALLLKHNLSLLDVQTKRNYIHKQIGEVGRRNPIKSIISAIICKFFFVEAIWTFGYDQHKNRSGQVLEIYGTPENVEMAEYVYDYLQNISELLWEEHKRQKKINGNRHRRAFIYGLLNGFYNKLDGRVIEHQSKKLVWKGDPRLKEFYRRRNPRLVRSSSRYSRSCKDTYNSGISRGKNLVIHKGIQGKGKGGTKLLN
ncbi:MAG: SprT-like family protein [Candidatus Scalindua rubra]|uniref:SprT-like family protein n=1 Tax=Candidatus Scalindua rubra TaxID=1872076 RepID=A0A1E3X325_9BACT|nr:MAG: SprT-like family protein [Candidatus Scalindua rubra]